jgi:hypothetical protein
MQNFNRQMPVLSEQKRKVKAAALLVFLSNACLKHAAPRRGGAAEQKLSSGANRREIEWPFR